MSRIQIDIPKDKIADFCRRWKITELSLFGSILREDFGPGSDVDILVTWALDAEWGLFDRVRLEEELSEIVGRKVDVVSRRVVEHSHNWIRRKAILESAETFHVER